MLHIATRDESAFAEIREHLSDFTEVERLAYEYTRIQSDDMEEIAAIGGADAYDNAPLGESEDDDAERDDGGDDTDRPPVVVEETGLFVDDLDGFPGPYTAYVEDTLGAERLWDLVAEADERRAVYRTGVAYADDERVVTFSGACTGELVAPRGPEDAGFDRLFEVQGTTFEELSVERKNALSSRARAMTKLADWLST